ncbi:MAG TPA: flagellar basal body L-ring protein FlgH [Desulfobacterales bacterium]|nr:flagellar basal body L-ring protein FlgH [Desulfobacterales bacterium]
MNSLIFEKNTLQGQIRSLQSLPAVLDAIRNFTALLICIALGGTTFLSGCVTPPGKASVQAPSSDIRGSQLENYPLPEPSEGSLWADSGSTKLFGDLRAREVGDLVTVQISETQSGKLDANTKTSRDSSIEAGITDLLGYMKRLDEKKSSFDRKSMFNANFKPSFDGKGSSDRSGSVVASITARVVRVLPNGNLYISGKREVRVNNETQYITVAGIIRPEDIGQDNVIQSTYIADARVEYTGKGVIADKQRPGWLMRILDHVWPF